MSAPDVESCGTVAHETRAHSSLGASGAYRWMNCPASIRLSVGQPNESTIFAAEGTAAHEIGEKCLLNGFQDAADFIGETVTVGNHQFVVDEEMAEAVQVYVDTIKADYEEGDILFIEARFDLEHVWPGMFGTNDCGLYKPASRQLKVYDYKHGKGHAVEVERNPQLIYYGVGLVSVPQMAGARIEDVELVIVQPRAPHRDGPVRRWTTSPVELLEFTADLQEAAARTEDHSIDPVAGDWCKFCPAAGICPALRKKAVYDAQAEFDVADPSELTETELSALLDKTDIIETGIRAIRREAYARAAGGRRVPGWKVVAKRANRKWGNEEQALATLTMTHDLDEDDIVEKKLRSPAQVEKLLPRPLRAQLEDLVVRQSSGTTLARETDRRPEVTPSLEAADEFDPI